MSSLNVKVYLKRKLDDFIIKYDGKVRFIRNQEREGLIRTRTRGAEEARGKVVLFLDAHCEVGLNWLPPLLYTIYLNRLKGVKLNQIHFYDVLHLFFFISEPR